MKNRNFFVNSVTIPAPNASNFQQLTWSSSRLSHGEHNPYPNVMKASDLEWVENHPDEFAQAIHAIQHKITPTIPAYLTIVHEWAKYFAGVSYFIKRKICHYNNSCKNGSFCSFSHTGEILRMQDGTYCIVTEKMATASKQEYRESLRS